LGPSILRAYWRTDAQTVSLTSGKVTQWSDQSGNGRHLLQASSTRRPTWTASSASIPGRSSITFGGSHFLSGAFNALAAATDWTIVGVFKSTNNAAARCSIYPAGSGGVALTIDAQGAGNREIRAVGIGNVSDAAATTNVEVWIADRDATTLHFYTGTTGTTRSLDAPTATVIAPGGALTLVGAITTGPVFGWVGDIYELAVLSVQLSAAQRADYLAEIAANYGAL
jgi:hypothetical protein